MPGFDPVSLGLGGLQTVGGILQSVFSGKHKTEKALEDYTNSYRKNPSIMDYYNKALNQYSANPYDSAGYRMATQNASRGLNTSLNALGSRRSLLAGLPTAVQGYNDANLKAEANAEGQQRANLGVLGNATRMKAAEDRVPFDLKYNLLAQKAAGANATKAAGWKNIFGGLGAGALGLGNKKSNGQSNNGNLDFTGYYGNPNETINPPS